jgi:hypothetical protein
MITVFTGLPGAGKSARTALAIRRVLKRNYRYFKKTGTVRPVYSNLQLNAELQQRYKILLRAWVNPEELISLRDCDVFWDEISTHLDATQWEHLPLDLKRWLQQHRKFGIEIYGNTQTFSTIDKSMRRLTGELYILKKLFGSRDPSPTRPPVKNVWGLVLVRKLDAQSYKEEEQENKAHGFGLMMLDKDLIDTFDTRQEIKMGSYPPMKHITRKCIDPLCGFTKTIHQ